MELYAGLRQYCILLFQEFMKYVRIYRYQKVTTLIPNIPSQYICAHHMLLVHCET